MSTPDPALAAALAEADRVLADLAEDAAGWLYDGARRLGMSDEHATMFAARQGARMLTEIDPADRLKEALRHVAPAGTA